MRSSDSFGCYVVIVVIGIIVAGIYSAGQWVYSKATGNRAQSVALLEEARYAVASAEADVNTLRIHATLKRLRLENGQWVYAGENETTGAYIRGPLGEGRVECVKDITPATEGPGFYRREFTAVFQEAVGRTLVTRQGILSETPSASDPELIIEKHRPRLMEACDAGTGWSCALVGRWPGSSSDSLLFSEFLSGKRPGTTLRADPDHIRELPTIRIRTQAVSGPVDIYWLDINNGYSIIRYERREAGSNRELESWEAKEFLRTPRGVYYPSVIDGEHVAPDGTVTEKWHLNVDHIWANNDDAATIAHLKPPAGRIVVHEEGAAEKTLGGTAAENAVAVNGPWANTTHAAPETVPAR